ncbi:uncharacterized protein LOC144181026 [Stigmatopora nigra]
MPCVLVLVVGALVCTAPPPEANGSDWFGNQSRRLADSGRSVQSDRADDNPVRVSFNLPAPNVTSHAVVAAHVESFRPNVTLDNVAISLSVSSKGCGLPTCVLHQLGSKLQLGDEAAGDTLFDPFGFGKK